MWPSQDNLSSVDLIRDYAEKRDKKCAYVEIFRAYVARKFALCQNNLPFCATRFAALVISQSRGAPPIPAKFST